MIDEVHIRDVALIHEATFAPSPAFTVVTGETGTGKTALLNALKILVGERAGTSFVREGCEELQVEGRFFGEGCGEDGVVAARRIGVQGRSRVSIDGSLASEHAFLRQTMRLPSLFACKSWNQPMLSSSTGHASLWSRSAKQIPRKVSTKSLSSECLAWKTPKCWSMKPCLLSAI